MRGGHCFKVWTKKQQMVSLSIGGRVCKLNLHLDASATICLVNHRKVCKSEKFVTKRAGTLVYPADLLTKPPYGYCGLLFRGAAQRAIIRVTSCEVSGLV